MSANLPNLGSPHYSETGCMYTLFSIKSARYKLFNSILPYILNCIIKQYALDIGYIYMWLRIEILRVRDLHCISMWKYFLSNVSFQLSVKGTAP